MMIRRGGNRRHSHYSMQTHARRKWWKHKGDNNARWERWLHWCHSTQRPWRLQVYKDGEGYHTLGKEDDEEEEEKEGTAMMCQWHCNTHGEELKKKTVRCSNDVSIPSKYPWKGAEKEEKKVQPNLFTIHARHGKGHTVGSQYPWKLSRWNHHHHFWGLDIIITDNEIRKERNKTTPQGWILCLLSEKEDENHTRNELIDVTTKSWNCLDEMGGHHHTSPFTMIKKKMTS